MASPDPLVVERQMYLNMLGWGVDDPNYSLGDLKDMTAGGANTSKSVQAAGTANNNNNSYLDHGDVSGSINITPYMSGVQVFNMTGATAVELGTARNGTSVNIFATGTGPLTVEDVEITTNECVAVRVRDEWLVRLIGSTLIEVTPAAATASDAANTYTIPSSVGTIYKVDGVVTVAGEYDAGTGVSTVIVEAIPASGYSFSAGATTSWVFNFTASLTWSTFAQDDFTGTNGTSIDGRALSGGTYTWDRTDASSATALIDTNRWEHVSAANYGVDVQLSPAPSNGAPAGYRVSFDYVGVDVSNKFYAQIKYQSIYYGPYYLNYWVRNGEVGRDATGDDVASSALVAEPGKSLTGNPTSGKFTVEISGLNVKIYINDVLIATGALPGALIQQTCAMGVSGDAPTGNVFIDNVLIEMGA